MHIILKNNDTKDNINDDTKNINNTSSNEQLYLIISQLITAFKDSTDNNKCNKIISTINGNHNVMHITNTVNQYITPFSDDELIYKYERKVNSNDDDSDNEPKKKTKSNNEDSDDELIPKRNTHIDSNEDSDDELPKHKKKNIKSKKKHSN